MDKCAALLKSTISALGGPRSASISAALIIFVLAFSNRAFSAAGVPTNAEMEKYHLSLIPEEFRTPIDRASLLPQELDKYCRSSEFAPWLRRVENTKDLQTRDQFLLSKLDRPFYFVGTSGDHFLGRRADLLDLACVHLVLIGGDFAHPAAPSITPSFLREVLNLPRINFPILRLVSRLWSPAGSETASGVLLLQHPAIDLYLARGFISEIFKPGVSSSVRIELLRALAKSQVYEGNRPRTLSILANEFSNSRVDPEARSDIFDLFFRELKLKFELEDRTRIAQTLIRNPLVGQDYEDVYGLIAQGSSGIEKSALLIAFLQSQVEFARAETIFKQEWSQTKDAESYRNLVSYLMDVSVAKRRLSQGTIFQSIQEAIQNPNFNARYASSILYLISDPRTLSPDHRLRFFVSVARTWDSIPMLSQSLLETGERLLRENPAYETVIADAVRENVPQYWHQSGVLTAYLNLIDRFSKARKLTLFESVLATHSIPDKELHNLTGELDRPFDGQAYRLTKAILAQKSVTASTLRALVVTMYYGISAPWSKSDLDLLDAIDSHPKANDEVRAESISVRKQRSPR
jgi:hypothetical protein